MQFLAFCVLNPCSAQWHVWELSSPSGGKHTGGSISCHGQLTAGVGKGRWRGGYSGAVLVTLFYSSCQQCWCCHGTSAVTDQRGKVTAVEGLRLVCVTQASRIWDTHTDLRLFTESSFKADSFSPAGHIFRARVEMMSTEVPQAQNAMHGLCL